MCQEEENVEQKLCGAIFFFSGYGCHVIESYLFQSDYVFDIVLGIAQS
jgi:hypothetical protein